MSLDVLRARNRTYPYVNARVRAMRADLITDGEYRKLAKMDLSEIAEFLGQRGYTGIEEYGADFEGAELLERAIRKRLLDTYRKLVRISPEPVQEMLQLYYRRFDVENVKMVLRSILRNPNVDLATMLLPTHDLSREELERWIEAGSVDEILQNVRFTGFDGSPLDFIEETDSLAAIEDGLDRYYYRNMLHAAERAGRHSEHFRDFLELEAALKNVNLILRLHRRRVDYETIMERVIDIPRGQQVLDTKRLANADTYDEAVDLVRKTPVGEHLDPDASPAEIGRALDRYKLEKGITMLHRDTLSINPILGFMICMEIEAGNVTTVIRATEEEMGEEFIERNLITGVAR